MRATGDGGNYTVSVPNNTATQLPEAANLVDGDYILTITNETGQKIYFRWTSGTTGGDLIDDDNVAEVEFKTGQIGYVYQTSGSAQTIAYGVKEVAI